MWVVFSKFLTPRGVTAIVIYPFIFTRDKHLKENDVTMNHEKIHVRQVIEMLIIPFYLWYVLEFFIRLIQYKDKHIAYLNISFEREAYTNENDLNYLKKRKLWTFFKYI